MANITSIAPVEEYAQREVPPFSKINAQQASKINTLRDNLILINAGMEELLQGLSGGAEQAKLPFVLSSAPTGWTRDTSFSTDKLLRVTDGVTAPPGASPNNTGGDEGGGWGIIGSSSGLFSDHQHSLQDHTHVLGSHTHTISPHAHTDGHTHNQNDHSHGVNTQTPALGSVVGFIQINTTIAGAIFMAEHGHTVAGHTHSGGNGGSGTTSGPTVTPTGNSSGETSDTTGATSGTSSGNLSSSSGSHLHTVSHGSSWRPKYLNIIMCKKD